MEVFMEKNQHMAELGRKGGIRRAESLSPERRQAIASQAGKVSSDSRKDMSRRGKLGGPARAVALSPERRREIAMMGAAARKAKAALEEKAEREKEALRAESERILEEVRRANKAKTAAAPVSVPEPVPVQHWPSTYHGGNSLLHP